MLSGGLGQGVLFSSFRYDRCICIFILPTQSMIRLGVGSGIVFSSLFKSLARDVSRLLSVRMDWKGREGKGDR